MVNKDFHFHKELTAIRELKNEKSEGVDNSLAELLKSLGKQAASEKIKRSDTEEWPEPLGFRAVGNGTVGKVK